MLRWAPPKNHRVMFLMFIHSAADDWSLTNGILMCFPIAKARLFFLELMCVAHFSRSGWWKALEMNFDEVDWNNKRLLSGWCEGFRFTVQITEVLNGIFFYACNSQGNRSSLHLMRSYVLRWKVCLSHHLRCCRNWMELVTFFKKNFLLSIIFTIECMMYRVPS